MVITNGVLLTDHAIETLESLGVERLEISVDGPKHIHDVQRASRNGASTYDRIIVDSSFTEMPRQLLERLAPNGTVVTAIGPPDGKQMAVHLTKIGNRFDRQDLFPVRFLPLEPGLAAAL